MIIGIGTDIISIERIKKASCNRAFVERIFSEKEIFFAESTSRKHEVYAGCFAAKEALSKALGTGIRNFSFKDIEILHNDMGAPCAVLHSNAFKIAKSIGAKNFFLSISHEREYCVAIVVIEG